MNKLLLYVLLTFLARAAGAQQVYVDYNHALNFVQFRTCAWGQQSNPNQIVNPFLVQEVKSQVNAQLRAKGLMLRQENEAPDLIVVASGGVKPQTSYNMWSTGGLGWEGGMASVTPETSLIGTLVVDLFDANNKQLAWRAVGRATLNQGNSNKNRQLVDKALSKMFRQYPSPSNK